MPSTLEKLVLKKVRDTKKAELDKAAEEERKQAEFQSKLPATREERARIVWPSITDGKWDIYFAAGHWRIRFFVGKQEFQIFNVYIPASSGTPSEGYMGYDAHWSQYLHATDPSGSMLLELGCVGDLSDSWLASRNDEPKNGWDSKKQMAIEIAKLNAGLQNLVEEFMLKKDEFGYLERFRERNRRRW